MSSSFPIQGCNACEQLRTESIFGSVKDWAERVTIHMRAEHPGEWAQKKANKRGQDEV